MFKKVGIALGITAAAVWAWPDLDDRPFVMSCMAENVFDYDENSYVRLKQDVATFDFTAGGIQFPSKAEMVRRSSDVFGHDGHIRGGYFGQGVMTDAQGALPKEHTTTAMVHFAKDNLAKYGRGDKVYRFDNYGHVIEDPHGYVEIEHLYMDGDGELHPIHFQIGALNIGKTSNMNRQFNDAHRQIHTGAFIPSDAKYVVYKATFRFENHENIDAGKEFSGYWATALTDKFRYQPNDYDVAKDHPFALGNYVQWSNVGMGRQHIGQPTDGNLFEKLSPAANNRGGLKGATVDCHGIAGQPVEGRRFFHASEDRLGEERNHIQRRPIGAQHVFIGESEEDLESLPSNPKNLERDTSKILKWIEL